MSLAISFLIGVLVEKEEVINGVVNVISLGMSFTCGVFVSMSVLGKGVRAFAHFLPVYWYEIVNEDVYKRQQYGRLYDRNDRHIGFKSNSYI